MWCSWLRGWPSLDAACSPGPKVNLFKTCPVWGIQLLRENKNQTNTVIQIRSEIQSAKIRIQALRVTEKIYFFLFGVCVCVEGVGAHSWRSEANFWESVFSFYQVGYRDQTQVIRLGVKYLYPESHLPRPKLSLQRVQVDEPTAWKS